MQTTLTIQLEQELFVYAQHYAEQQGTSVSQLVAEFFAQLAQQQEASPREQLPPITRSLVGVLRGAKVDEQDYNTYLEEKYL